MTTMEDGRTLAVKAFLLALVSGPVTKTAPSSLQTSRYDAQTVLSFQSGDVKTKKGTASP